MKVIFLPNNTASLMSTTIPRLRERGIKAYGFNFAPKVFQDTDNIFNLPRTPWGLVLFVGKFLYHLITADTVHWIYGSNSRSATYILKIVALIKRHKFIEFCGTDIRNLEHLCDDVDFYKVESFSENLKFLLGTELTSNTTQLKFHEFGFKPMPNSPELDLYINPHVFDSYYPVMRSIDIEKLKKIPTQTNAIPLVIHMPSNPEVKGSNYVIEAAKKLELDGKIKFHLITNTPHEEALKILSKADIVIDQMIIGEYGVLSIEAMAMGKPVICFIRPELAKVYSQDFKGFPIHNANIKNIEQKLEELVVDKELRQKLGVQGKIFADRYHDSVKNTDALIQIYNLKAEPKVTRLSDNFKKLEPSASIDKIRGTAIQFSKIASTNFFVMIVSFLFYPFIARQYSPEEFGVFAFFSSLVVVLSILITGQYHNAVVNPDSDEDAKQLISISTWITLFSSLTILLGVAFVGFYWQLGLEWYFFPFYLVTFTTFEIWRMHFVRSKEYSVFNTSQLINRIGSNVLKISKPVPWKSGWLILSEILCYSFAAIYLLVKGKFFVLPFTKIKWSIAREYKKFPLFQSSSLLIQLLISEFPAFYFKGIGDLDSLGYYSMGNRLFIQPIIILGNSLNPILIHKFRLSKNIRSNEIKQIFMLIGLTALAIFGVLFFFKNTFVHYFLGNQWSAGSRIYELQLWLILSKLFLGTILAYIIAQNKSYLLMVVRGIELALLLLLVRFIQFPFLETYIGLELIADFTLINMVFWTKPARNE